MRLWQCKFLVNINANASDFHKFYGFHTILLISHKNFTIPAEEYANVGWRVAVAVLVEIVIWQNAMVVLVVVGVAVLVLAAVVSVQFFARLFFYFTKYKIHIEMLFFAVLLCSVS